MSQTNSTGQLFDDQFGGGRIETHCCDGVVWSEGRCGPRATDRRRLERV